MNLRPHPPIDSVRSEQPRSHPASTLSDQFAENATDLPVEETIGRCASVAIASQATQKLAPWSGCKSALYVTTPVWASTTLVGEVLMLSCKTPWKLVFETWMPGVLMLEVLILGVSMLDALTVLMGTFTSNRHGA